MWFVYIFGALLTWAMMGLFYRMGALNAVRSENYVPLKLSVAVGVVFVPIVVAYLLMREEDFSIWESFVRFYPATIYAFVYAIVNTISFSGNVYNEAGVESPLENLDQLGVILLSVAFVLMGKAESVWEVLTARRMVGTAFIVAGFVLLAVVRQKESNLAQSPQKKHIWQGGAAALVFPLLYSLMSAGETVATGVFLDKTYGYAMPEDDAVIIAGSVYILVTAVLWLFLLVKEKKPYNPFAKNHLPMLGGAVFDNVGAVFYLYAIALNSVVTYSVLCAYPVLTMIFARILLREKLSWKQYACLALVIIGAAIIAVEMA